MGAFPGTSETFILNEMDWLEKRGINIRLLSLSHKAGEVLHDLAKKWVTRTQWAPSLFSPTLWHAHLHFALIKSKKYFYALRHYRDYGGKKDFIKSVYFAKMVEKEAIHHIYAQYGWNAGLAMQIAYLTGASYSFIMHHADIYLAPLNMAQVINGSCFCVTISEYNKEWICEKFPDAIPTKINVIHCGIEISKFKPAGRDDNNKSPINLLSVSRLKSHKQVDHFIRICDRLTKKGYKVLGTIVGDGPRRLEIVDLIHTLRLEGIVSMPGALSQEELFQFFQSSDILIITSRSEGIPVTAMEAMACGLPVIAPNIMGIPELVIDRETGFLFPVGDLDIATDALIRLIEDPSLRFQMGKRGREKVIREFNIEHTTRKLAKLMSESIKAQSI